VPFQTKSQKAIFCQLSEPITLLVMESLNFVDTIIRGAILTGSFFLFLLLERVLPLRRRSQNMATRWTVNAVFTTLAFLTGFLVVRNTTLLLTDWTTEHSFGLLHWLPLGETGQWMVGFLLMDLTFYYWHRANHSIRFLWRFHNVHHMDPDMDVTTSFRFHFVEVLFSVGFRSLQVGLLGVGPAIYMFYELVFQTATMFHHSNWRLPITIERLLNKVIVTPRMHGIHHSSIEEQTNSNYSTVFRFWDLINRSLILNVIQSQIIIGVPGYRRAGDNKLGHLIVLPFLQQRDYWPLDQKVESRPADRTLENMAKNNKNQLCE